MARNIPALVAVAGASLLLAATPAVAVGTTVASTAGATLLGSLPAGWLGDDGQPVDLHALRGQRLVVTMAYANCHRICPMTVMHLQALQRSLDAAGSTATFIVVGYDPEVDDPGAWHQYRRERRLGRPNWLFLTASSPRQVREFAGRLGFEFWKYDEHVMHDERVVVIDPRGELQYVAGPGQPIDLRRVMQRTPTTSEQGTPTP